MAIRVFGREYGLGLVLSVGRILFLVIRERLGGYLFGEWVVVVGW